MQRRCQVSLWFGPLVIAPSLFMVYRWFGLAALMIAGIANTGAVLIAAWILSGSFARKTSEEQKWIAIAGCLLVAPITLMVVIAGMGPPPQEAGQWLATSQEQKTRYALLLVVGLLAAGGFAVLKECLRQAGEHFYSTLGFTAMVISTTLFVFYITGFITLSPEALRQWESSGKMPDWYTPVARHAAIIGLVEVALAYLATAAFATALRKVGWLERTASRVFVTISLIAAPAVLLSPFYPSARMGLPIFVLAIPAVPFVVPYLIGVRLLRRAGSAAG